MASVNDGNGSTVTLNIMPMLDIFSILILFLLMSFSTDPVSHEISKNTSLPVSATLRSLDEIPTITISKSQIIVNGKVTNRLVNRAVRQKDLLQGAVLNVYQELEKISDANKKFNENKKGKTQSVTLEIDKSHQFNLIKQVLLAAQQADFVKFKLLVTKSRS